MESVPTALPPLLVGWLTSWKVTASPSISLAANLPLATAFSSPSIFAVVASGASLTAATSTLTAAVAVLPWSSSTE